MFFLKLISFTTSFFFLLSAGCQRGGHYNPFVGLLAGLAGGLISVSVTRVLVHQAQLASIRQSASGEALSWLLGLGLFAWVLGFSFFTAYAALWFLQHAKA